ncbi:hypothetical protein [Maridesulfovibrio ferrireducens]|uniref:hypothetical protein n=1 Tax=Maridesulfovibrio ferrireducens TaxID=246191 RepID=UPI001A2B4C20|nr:hypothetical protein [Maridesulfovibrio ferrireducens]MBI9111294.1 hypothetical protein [Maridesulfovibrio ferrireducens]
MAGSTSQSKRVDLDIWFIRNEVLKKDVATKLDVTPQRLSQILNGKYTRHSVYKKLCNLELDDEGLKLPVDLIPLPAKAQKTGPKAKDGEV